MFIDYLKLQKKSKKKRGDGLPRGGPGHLTRVERVGGRCTLKARYKGGPRETPRRASIKKEKGRRSLSGT